MSTAIYRYSFSRKAATYVLMPIISFASIGIGVFLLAVDSAFVGGFLILVGVWLALLSAFGSLLCSSIAISDEGIAAQNFGRTLKSVAWQNVIKVKKVRRWNAGSRSFEDTFYIFDGTFSPLRMRMVNWRGPIAFASKINGLRKLLDDINASALQYRFPISVVDQEAAQKLAAERGAGAWKRAVPKIEEIPLAAL